MIYCEQPMSGFFSDVTDIVKNFLNLKSNADSSNSHVRAEQALAAKKEADVKNIMIIGSVSVVGLIALAAFSKKR